MGFALTLLYLVTAYLGPATIFGSFATFHIGLILAGLVLLVSLPTLSGSFLGKTPQSLALIGLAFATFLSLLMTGWAGGAMQVFLDFIPNAFAYYVVCLHCDSKKKLQILILMLLLVCLFVIAHAYVDLQHQPLQNVRPGQVPAETPYLLPQESDAGVWFYRIRGQDFIADPNDFAQVIVCTTPLLFIFWKQKKFVRNFTFILVPVCVLLYGAYLTHSRGSILAMMAMTVVALRRRLGTVRSLLLAGGLYFVASVLHFTGGRDISADAGADRMDAWAFGLQLLISHPIFGVGYGRFTEFYYITAHNSVVVCAAELGLFGLYFWSLFLLPTVRDALALASPNSITEGEPIVPKRPLSPLTTANVEKLDKEEVNRMGRLLVMSLTGFLVAGWFLSRAFTMTLFLLGGMVEVVFEMALRRGMIAPRLPMTRMFRYAILLTVSLPAFIYIFLRFGNILR